jgi:hypothetical protein
MPQERGKKTHTLIGIRYEGELKTKIQCSYRSFTSRWECSSVAAILLQMSSCFQPLSFALHGPTH